LILCLVVALSGLLERLEVVLGASLPGCPRTESSMVGLWGRGTNDLFNVLIGLPFPEYDMIDLVYSNASSDDFFHFVICI
jgi:hypothetical protein